MLTLFQLRRFSEGARHWLLGAGWLRANAERGVTPILIEFVAIREMANGTFLAHW